MILFARALAAGLLAAGLFVASYAAAARLLRRGPALLRWTGVVVGAAWIASTEFHLLSAFGAFRLGATLALTAFSTALAVSAAGRGELRSRSKRDLRWLGRMRGRLAESPQRGAAFAISLLASLVVIHSLLLPPLGWDSLTYHAVKAAMWVQQGGIGDFVAPGTWALYQNFWGGAEVLMAWAMLPFHGDTLAMGAQGACWLAMGLALVALARELGAREPFASAAAALALATPTVRMQVGTGYVEVVALAFLVSGLALAVTFLRRPDGGVLLLSAAALGLAAGVKLPYAPAGLLVFVAVSLRAVAGKAPLHRPGRWVAAGSLIFAVGVSPWLWHAYKTSGAPFSPVPLNLLGLDLGRANPEVEANFARPSPTLTVAAELERLLEALVQGYENPGPATVFAMVVGVMSLPWIFRRRPLPALLVLLVLVVSWLQYYSPGLSHVRHYWPASSVRFLLVPLVLGTALSAVPFRPHERRGRFYLWFLWIGTFLDFGLYLAHDVSPRCAVGIAATFSLVAASFVALRGLFACTRSKIARSGGLLLTATVFLVAIDGLHDRLRPELARVGFVSGPVEPYWFRASVLVDEPARPRRIAVTSGPWVMADNWFVYPFLGRHLQNRAFYVPVAKDGRVRHFGSPEINDEYRRAADYSSWLSRLRQAGVTEVMSFSPPSIELGWMESHPEAFGRLTGSAGDWGLFELRDGPRSAVNPKGFYALAWPFELEARGDRRAFLRRGAECACGKLYGQGS